MNENSNLYKLKKYIGWTAECHAECKHNVTGIMIKNFVDEHRGYVSQHTHDIDDNFSSKIIKDAKLNGCNIDRIVLIEISGPCNNLGDSHGSLDELYKITASSNNGIMHTEYFCST